MTDSKILFSGFLYKKQQSAAFTSTSGLLRTTTSGLANVLTLGAVGTDLEWRKRYCILTDNGWFSYYNSEKEAKSSRNRELRTLGDLQRMTPTLGCKINTNKKFGLTIISTTSGGPADTAGLLGGDLILGVNGHPTEKASELLAIFSEARPGDVLQFRVQRLDEELDCELTVGSKDHTPAQVKKLRKEAAKISGLQKRNMFLKDGRVRELPKEKFGKKYCFSVNRTTERMFFLRAPNKQAYGEWIQALRTAIGDPLEDCDIDGAALKVSVRYSTVTRSLSLTTIGAHGLNANDKDPFVKIYCLPDSTSKIGVTPKGKAGSPAWNHSLEIPLDDLNGKRLRFRLMRDAKFGTDNIVPDVLRMMTEQKTGSDVILADVDVLLSDLPPNQECTAWYAFGKPMPFTEGGDVRNKSRWRFMTERIANPLADAFPDVNDFNNFLKVDVTSMVPSLPTVALPKINLSLTSGVPGKGVSCTDASPNIYTELSSNEFGKVIKMTLESGAEDKVNEKPLSYLHVISGGDLKITEAGVVQDMTLETGQSIPGFPAGIYQIKNAGESTVEVLFLEPTGIFSNTPHGHKDPFETNPEIYSVLGKDRDWYIGKMDLKAGAQDSPCSQHDNFGYVVSGDQLSITLGEDQKTSAKATIPLQAGQVIPFQGGFRSITNTGQEDASIIFFEMRHGPGKYISCTQASPEIYQVLLENEFGRFIKQTMNPGDEDKAHERPNHYFYVLSGGDIEGTTNGKVSGLSLPDGTAVAGYPSGTIQCSNVGETKIEILILEPSGNFGQAPARHVSPFETNPEMYTIMGQDDDWVIGMLDMKVGAEDKPHSNFDHFVYILAGDEITFYPGEEKTVPIVSPLTPGQILPLPSGFQSLKNSGTQDLKLVFFEQRHGPRFHVGDDVKLVGLKNAAFNGHVGVVKRIEPKHVVLSIDGKEKWTRISKENAVVVTPEPADAKAEADAQDDTPADAQDDTPADAQDDAPADAQEDAPADAQDAPADAQEDGDAPVEAAPQSGEAPAEVAQSDAPAEDSASTPLLADDAKQRVDEDAAAQTTTDELIVGDDADSEDPPADAEDGGVCDVCALM